MWELDYKESWVPKNWCFWTVELEKTLESPLDCKEIKPVIPKGISPECSLEGLMLKLKLILWPPDVENWLTGKDPDAGIDWRQEEKGMTKDEMVGWHHWLNGHEFEQAPGVCDGQGSLACCSPWGHRVRQDWGTEVNWQEETEKHHHLLGFFPGGSVSVGLRSNEATTHWLSVFFVTKCFSPSPLFFFFLAAPHSMQDHSSPTRDWTWAPGSESAES